MKQRLIVRQEGPDSWCVSGEGMNFYISCIDKESALLVAHRTRNKWYPRARVVIAYETDFGVIEYLYHPPTTAAILREERFQRTEWRDQMRSDWNE